MKTQTKFLPLFLVLLLACLLPVSQTSAQNLVNNPGFETGDLTGWTQSGDTSFTGVAAGFGNNGTFGLFAGPLSNGFLSQTLSTVVGQVYSVIFWLNSDGLTPNFFAVNFGATTLFSMNNVPSTGGYVRYAFSATATSASTVLQFTFQDSPSFLGLDDVSVSTPDNGASAFLLLLGLAALGAARAFTSLRPVRA